MTKLMIIAVLVLAVTEAGSHDHHRVKRVIGGKVVDDAARWPWLVSLRGSIPKYRLFGFTVTATNVVCGGSLINSQWVLTAAHCVINEKLGLWSQVPLFWTARMGDINRDADLATDIKDFFAEALNVDEGRDYDIDAERIFVHPQYDPKRYWLHDMALLKLTRPAPSTKYTEGLPVIKNVDLDTGVNPGFPPDGAPCMFKGWGCQQFGGSLEDVARQVELKKVSSSNCARLWNIDMRYRICAGDRNTGICSGDSGGPLVCRNPKNNWVQVGVASFTSPSGGSPGVFTSVSDHYDWIITTIEGHSRDN